MSTFTNNLPSHWAAPALSDLSIFVIGGDWGKAPSLEDDDFLSVYCIRGAEFKFWRDERGKTASLRKVKRNSLKTRKLQEGDILIEISGGGPEQPVGRSVLVDKTAISHNEKHPKVCTNFLRLFRPSAELNPKYLEFFLKYFYNSGEVVKYQAGSNNLRNLKFNDYISIKVPFSPLNEQHRIVAKIEELFSELDKGIESLKTAREQLKVYRQSLLKHAFEGKLTEQWRKDNADKLESADDLLARIQQERETRYQQQLEGWKTAVKQWEAEGKEGKKPSKPKVLDGFSYLTSTELDEVNDLPETWCWQKIGNISNVSGGLTKNSKRESFELQYPYLRVANVYANRLELDEIKTIGVLPQELDRVLLKDGDLLIVEGNGSIEQIGRVAVWSKEISPCLHQNHLIKARLLPSMQPGFIVLFLLSKVGRDLIVKEVSSTSGLHTLSLSKVSNLKIPLTSNKEQQALLQILDEKLSVVDLIEREINDNIKRSEALRQSILKKAFSGQLVAQDPNDEPASVLLERIKAEKAEQDKQNKARKTTKRKLKA